MDNINIIKAVTEEKEIAEKDADMATEAQLVSYYNGKAEAYEQVLLWFER